jgi:hypothetical protein
MEQSLPLISFQSFINEATKKTSYQNLLNSSSLEYYLTIDIDYKYRSAEDSLDLLNSLLASLNDSVLNSRYHSAQRFIRGFAVKESKAQNALRFHILLSNKKVNFPELINLKTSIRKIVHQINRDSLLNARIKDYEIDYYDKEKIKSYKEINYTSFDLYHLSNRRINNDVSILSHDGVNF